MKHGLLVSEWLSRNRCPISQLAIAAPHKPTQHQISFYLTHPCFLQNWAKNPTFHLQSSSQPHGCQPQRCGTRKDWSCIAIPDIAPAPKPRRQMKLLALSLSKFNAIYIFVQYFYSNRRYKGDGNPNLLAVLHIKDLDEVGLPAIVLCQSRSPCYSLLPTPSPLWGIMLSFTSFLCVRKSIDISLHLCTCPER